MERGVRAALAAASRAVEGLVDTEPLAAALATWEAPWRIAVVGRTSAGKSSLVNAALGRPARPIGLGGVTRTVAEEPAGTVIWVDTPGIDGVARGISDLGPVLDEADATVWVVDALQSMTRTEREVLRCTRVPDTPLHVVVSHADLVDPAEVGSVLARVDGLAAPFGATAAVRTDLRGPCTLPAHLSAVEPERVPRRVRAVAAAIGAVRAALAALPPAPAARELRRAAQRSWSDAVHQVASQVEDAVRAGALPSKTEAADRLFRRASTARHTLLDTWRHDPVMSRLVETHGAPPLPLPERARRTAVRDMLGSFSGAEGALRVLRAAAARWLAEGQVVISDWLADLDAEAAVHAARTSALSALDDAYFALPQATSSPSEQARK